MAKRVWKSIIRRKNKPSGKMPFDALEVTLEEECPVVFRAKDTPAESSNKRFTINLGVEDLPAVPRPESFAKFYTDDEVGVVKRRRSSLALGSSGDEEDANPFLMREHLRKEDAERLKQSPRPETCYLDKEIKLRQRRKSLFIAQEEMPLMLGVPQMTGLRPHAKRDGMCLEVDRPPGEEEGENENAPSGEGVNSPGSDKVFFGDDANGSAGSPTDDKMSPSMRQDIALSVATQMLAGMSGDDSVFGDVINFGSDLPPVPPPRPKRDARKKARERMTSSSAPSSPQLTSSSQAAFPFVYLGSPDGSGSPTDTPGSASSTRSFLLPESLDSPAVRSRTIDYRTKRKSQEVEGASRVYKQLSSDDLSRARNRVLVRSVSEFVEQCPKGTRSGNRRSNSDKLKTRKGDKDSSSSSSNSSSFRNRLFRSTRKDSNEEGLKTSRSLPTRTFDRIRSVKIKKDGGSRTRTESSGGDVEGVVAGVHQQQQRNGDRGSSPSSPSIGASRSAESTPIKIVNLLSKFKKGGRSAKLDNSLKHVEGSLENSEDTLRSARSHESLHSVPNDHEATPSPLHERARISVNRDELRRTENTLKIWVMEAKGIPNKKKYFCQLILNNEPQGRTVSKQKSNMCFWGEYFELNFLPQVSTICIELMREADKKPGYKKIGTVEIDLKPSSPGRVALVEQWYPVKVDKPDREIPNLRIKHRFQSLDILPLSQYGAFRQYLKDNATSLCQLLEPVVSVKSKEDIATTLVNIMQKEERAITFLVSLILADIQRIADNEHLLFRGNSVATKAIEAYMRLVGEHYLQETLSDSIKEIISTSEDLEVDPLRINSIQYLPRQREVLKERVSSIWNKIIQSGRSFPVELRKVFHTIRERLSRQDKCELTDNLISACVFLRFLCPAVLSPSLFNIIQEYPDERAGRNLTLVAKTLQTLANFTHFQGKESFMEFLNDFIDKEQEKCRAFLRTISSPPSRDETDLEFDGDIDLGKHLAQLHVHLTEAITKIDTQGYESEASKVLALVEDINIFLGGDQKEIAAMSQHAAHHALMSTPPLVPSSSSLPSATHPNNNYIREGCGDGLNVVDAQMASVMGGEHRSQSLPRAAAPIYTHHQMQAGMNPSVNSPYRDKTAANDLTTSDDYVLITAFDHQAEPQNYMYPSLEANNNNTPMTDMRLGNSNTYYMAEVAPPASPLRQTSSPGPHMGGLHQPVRGHVHHRLHPRAQALSSRSHSLTGVPNAIERRALYQEECSELYSYMDSCSHKIHALCMDSENNIQGSQTSISQLSNVASSGYQSFAYSQSSSPVDSLLHTDNSSLLSRENGNSGPPGGLRQVLHGSPIASPMHQPHSAKHRAVAVHPAYLGHAGHVSLHGTPRHIPRVPQPKGSPNSSLSSSQSVEDLSSLRRGRTRQRRSASSSSDSSPDTRPASHSHSHSRRPHAHPPRTNPHCSPRLVPSQAIRHELRARSRYDRSASGRRGKNMRSCERDDFPRGSSHCYEDSEDDISHLTQASTGGGGVGSWVKDGTRLSQEEHLVPSTIASQQILDQQEDQMRAIVERLMAMEQEFRLEQEIMRREMHDKDARIDAQAKKIAALDTANTELLRTIASLSARSSDMKVQDHELPVDTTIDSCNASDTSDYKSSSC